MDNKVFRDNFLQSKIDEYKYGVISADEFCKAMEDLGKYLPSIGGKSAERAVRMIPEICRSYTEAGESDQGRDLKFWIGLKDCEQLIRGNRTFTEEREEFYRTGKGRYEPVEYTDRYLSIEPEMERLIREETGEGGWTGFCHTYWAVKKKVLKEHFGIDWKSIDDRFPGLLID